MKTLVLAAAAAGTVLVGGVAAANAQWSLSGGFRGEGGAPSGDYASVYGPDCGFVTVREHRDGHVVIRRIPRC
jgi:hypothetical protein